MEDSYYNIPRCSNSMLTRIKRELMGLEYQPASEATLLFGRMFHTALLEPTKYNAASIDTKSSIMIEAMIQECRKSFMINHFCTAPQSRFEKENFFDFNGVPFKMKSDVILHDWICDPKTTSCNTQEDFLNTLDEYGYWRQAALYMYGENCSRFTFWGVRKSVNNPKLFIVNAHEYPKKLAEALEEARMLCDHYMWKHHKENLL